jgi:hypothetical protein
MAAEKYDRSFAEIVADARVPYSTQNSWAQLAPILFEKWEAIGGLSDEKLATLKTRTDSQVAAKQEVPYLLRHDLCAFCLKAVAESRAVDYGVNGASCKACVLQARCYDGDWVVYQIFIAMRAGDYSEVRKLMAQGRKDVMTMIAAAHKDDDVIGPR